MDGPKNERFDQEPSHEERKPHRHINGIHVAPASFLRLEDFRSRISLRISSSLPFRAAPAGGIAVMFLS